MVVGTTVNAPAPAPATSNPLISSNVFSARLVHSVPFEFAGKRHDLAKTIGYGVTQFGTAAATAVDPPPKGYDVVIPFSGSAIALADIAR